MQNYFRQSFESWVAGLRRLLETWSPCSRLFAILPVSAVSDAQKLATGNFLHVRAYFLVTFCTMQKVTTRSLCREYRGFANLESAHKDNTFIQTKLNPLEKFRGFANLESAHTNNNPAQNKLNPFSALRRYPCRDGTLRVLFNSFLQAAKRNINPFSL